MKSKTQRGRRTPLFFGITFRVVLIIAAVCLSLSYLSIYINPASFSFTLFFGLFYIPILLINIFLLILALIRRSKSALIPIVAIIPSLLFLGLFVQFGNKKIDNNNTPSIVISTYNVGTFNSSHNNLTREECRTEIVNYFYKINPDILCLQEVFVDDSNMADTIFSQYPYRYHHLFKVKNGKLFGNMTFSRYPIVNHGDICFEQSTNLSIFTDILYNGKTIRLYNNHLESYNISFTRFVKKFSSNSTTTEEIRNDIKMVHEKMLGTFIKRTEQVNILLESIKNCSLPAIICGDFNDTPISYTYHKLRKGRKDSFIESGSGFGGSFVHLWPLLRIDYILFPDQFSSLEHTTEKIMLSDHFPIKAKIVI